MSMSVVYCVIARSFIAQISHPVRSTEGQKLIRYSTWHPMTICNYLLVGNCHVLKYCPFNRKPMDCC